VSAVHFSEARIARLGRLMVAAYQRGQRDRSLAFMGRMRRAVASRPTAMVRRLEAERGLA
jgi:hypothetical protein